MIVRILSIYLMKITKEKAEENRAALVAAASRLFREKGIDGVGVSEISKAAGLTHGALYAHFDSKEELAAAALAWGAERANARLYSNTLDGEPDLEDFLSYYLSPEQRDNYAGHCAMAASASEIGRQDAAASASFNEGYMVFVRAFERKLAAANPGGDALPVAMGIVAAMIGAVAVSRATAKARPEVSAQVLKGARQLIDNALAGGVPPRT
jgi:TetR/AcrR family transcriptional repressor of nem operon